MLRAQRQKEEEENQRRLEEEQRKQLVISFIISFVHFISSILWYSLLFYLY